MSEQAASFISGFSAVFFLRQSLVILMIFALGAAAGCALRRGRAALTDVLLYYPLGLSVYALVSYVILVTGIPFNIITVTGSCLAVAAVSALAVYKNGWLHPERFEKKITAAVIITLLCIIVISTSGLLPVSVMNDSMYYYSMYPKALVHFSGYRRNFNVFLTDIGQMTVIINTLPHMYGFNESFGIQTFLNIDTLLLFSYSVYERAAKKTERKSAAAASVILTLILVSSMPYLVMSRWVMSNGYFMCFMFICVHTVYASSKEADAGSAKSLMVLSGLMFSVMSFLRMEGCIIAVVLVLCFASLEFEGKELFKYLMLPMLLIFSAYDVRIFLFMNIDAPYTFLTPNKAVIQLAALAAVSVYLVFIKGRFLKFTEDKLSLLIPAALLFVNILLFVYNRSRYINNLKSFAGNLSHRSGWGLFPMMILAVYVLCFIAGIGGRLGTGGRFCGPFSFFKKGPQNRPPVPKIHFRDLCLIAYLLTCLAVGFARGDNLRESIGDSGNRVLLQVTVLAFYAAAMHLTDLLWPDVEEPAGN
ncbi:MAG: hypothetical protein K6F34_06695 [Lachnospiraceae bacterium]|nr:hypothetical protein [Lachnospiraceae bacterium]